MLATVGLGFKSDKPAAINHKSVQKATEKREFSSHEKHEIGAFDGKLFAGNEAKWMAKVRHLFFNSHEHNNGQFFGNHNYSVHIVIIFTEKSRKETIKFRLCNLTIIRVVQAQ